jgi:hypothetical protein
MAVISRYAEWLLAHARKRTTAPDSGYPCIRGANVPDNLVANLAGFLPIRKKPKASHRPSRSWRSGLRSPMLRTVEMGSVDLRFVRRANATSVSRDGHAQQRPPNAITIAASACNAY